MSSEVTGDGLDQLEEVPTAFERFLFEAEEPKERTSSVRFRAWDIGRILLTTDLPRVLNLRQRSILRQGCTSNNR